MCMRLRPLTGPTSQLADQPSLSKMLCHDGSRDNSKCIKEEKEKDRDKKENPTSSLPPQVQALMSTIPSPEESPNYLVYKKVCWIKLQFDSIFLTITEEKLGANDWIRKINKLGALGAQEINRVTKERNRVWKRSTGYNRERRRVNAIE